MIKIKVMALLIKNETICVFKKDYYIKVKVIEAC